LSISRCLKKQQEVVVINKDLVEKFKREINEGIKRRLMEVECPPKSINQWYERVVRLERNYRKSKRKEEEKRNKREKEEREEKKRIEKK